MKFDIVYMQSEEKDKSATVGEYYIILYKVHTVFPQIMQCLVTQMAN